MVRRISLNCEVSQIVGLFISGHFDAHLSLKKAMKVFSKYSEGKLDICRCMVPGINLLTPVLDFGKCFINHPYEMTMELMNDSDLPAKYELIAQVRVMHTQLF